MYAKLTLNIDESIIRNAKRYAKKHQISISKIIEKYLANITGKLNISSRIQNSTITDELSGVLGNVNKGDLENAKYLYGQKPT